MITSFRMYNAGPKAAAAWRALFSQVFREAGVDIEIVDHRWPQPIAALWAQPELAGAFMCGWPFVRSGRMQAIAAPVPSPPRYEGLPRYCSDYVVRAESGWTRLEDSFGHRFGWMAADSQSGFNAPRAHLATFLRPGRTELFSSVAGPLGAPMTTLEALRKGEADIVALDGFWLDLLRHHEPARLEGLRIVASTPWTPIPLLVAAPGVDATIASRLRDVLTAFHRDASHASLLGDVLLRRFVAPDVASYAELERMAESASRSSYPSIR
jgi:ABC-type phosphate/phosphonate transport system substrate-binding protein